MKITLVGGGSTSWAPILVQSFILNKAFEGAEVYLYDIDGEALARSMKLCKRYAAFKLECRIEFKSGTDLDEALKGAKYVVVSISHGGLEAELEDHRITRRYGYYNIKGLEVGISGASRTLRMVPELVRIGRHMKEMCPDAMMFDVSNPLSAITHAVRKYAGVETVGLCHGVKNHLRILMPMIGLECDDIDKVDFNVAGVDHCSWHLSAKYNGQDAFKKIREDGWIEKAYQNEKIGEFNDPFAGKEFQRLRFMLWDVFGYMPAISDEHIVEFFGQMINGEERRNYYGMHYDRIAERTKTVNEFYDDVSAKTLEDTPLEPHSQGEIVDKLVSALEGYGPYSDIMNYQNVGQVENLPLGITVETRVYVDSCGFHPVHAGALPRALENVVRPVAQREELFMEAAMEHDFDKLRTALVMDPLVFEFRKVDEICKELFAYNDQFRIER